MVSYRLEEASSGRAGCQNKECKDAKVKILKGELRLGTWVDSERFQSFFWRHWGCVTPKIIANMNENAEGEGDEKNLSEIDGFDELSSENQEKIRKAVEQGHVDDEEWKGDVEMNRPGKTGFRQRGSKKKAAAEEESSPKKEEPTANTKKRRRAPAAKEESKSESEDEAPTPKKVTKKGGRGKQAAEKEVEAEPESASEEEVKPKPAAKRGRPAKKAATDDAKPKATAKKQKTTEENGDAEAEPVAEKPKRGRKKKSA